MRWLKQRFSSITVNGSFIRADYLKNMHDYLLSLATIDKLVGTKIR